MKRKTRYEFFEIGEGRGGGGLGVRVRVMMGRWGGLRHGAWTCWGHLGAPLLLRGGGRGVVFELG